MLRKLWLDFLYPPRCSRCLRRIQSGVLCADCASGVELNRTLFCARCGARLPGGIKICHRDEPCLLGGAVNYDQPAVQALVRDLKFRGLRDAAQPLGEWLAAYASILPARLRENAVLVPIPLSGRRERSRGFNQSVLIAEVVAGKLGLGLNAELLRRQKHSAPQSDLRSTEERKNNVRGCFSAGEKARDKSIILIDDVVTSGSTLREAALALRAAGAKQVLALAAARA